MASHRNLIPLFILLGVVALAVLGSGVVWYWQDLQKTKEVDALMLEAQEAHSLLSNPSRAMVTCRKILDLDPERWEAHYLLGRAALALDKIAEAIQAFENALPRASAELRPRISLALGQAYRRRYEGTGADRDFRLARNAFQTAEASLETEAESLHALGVMYMSENQRDLTRALELLQRLLRKHPDYKDREAVQEVVTMLDLAKARKTSE